MYSKIDTLFWSDGKIRAMSPDARYIILYLLTTPHRNILGCYHLPKLYVMADTKLSQNKFTVAWKEVIKSGMVKYDEQSEMILVCNFLKYNPLENPNQVKGAIAKLKELPETPFFADIADILGEEASKTDLQELIKALYMRSGIDVHTVSGTVAQSVTERVLQKGLERVSETVTESIPKQRNSNSISNSNNIHDEDDSNYSHNARAHEEIPEESIAEYLDYSDTATAISSHIEPDEIKRYICTSWKYHTGRSPNATNIDDIRAVAVLNTMQVGTINEAIRLAAKNAGGSITGYACQCLKDWAARGMHALDEIYEADAQSLGLM